MLKKVSFFFYYPKVQNSSLIIIYHIVVTCVEWHNSHACGIYMTQFCEVKRKNASPNCELRIQLLLYEADFYRIITIMHCRKFCKRLIIRNLIITH